MNARPILTVLLLALGLVLPSLAAPRTSPAPAQHTLPVCTCCPHVVITFAPSCNCTIQLANEVRKIGQCPIGNCLTSPPPHFCGDPTKSCKLTATANEVGGGCTGTQDINIGASCGNSNSVNIPCSSNGGATFHNVRLDCDSCACPTEGNCL